MTTLNNTELTKDVDALLSTINCYGGTGIFFEMIIDFLSPAFTEMVASDEFAKMTPGRRKRLVGRYDDLRAVLNGLDEFSNKYPDEMKIKNVEVESFE